MGGRMRQVLGPLMRPPGRQTNQALLVMLILAFGTGVATIAVGSPRAAWVAIGHGICGLAVVLLIPWKSRVARTGLKRNRPDRWISLMTAAVALLALFVGIASSTGLIRSIAGQQGLWVHILLAILLVPLVGWHVWVRGIQPRRTDLSRRALLRAGVVAAGAAALYTAATAVVNVLGLPGTRRRFTGSYERGSFDPAAMPPTIWLFDEVPTVDPRRYRLTIDDARGHREMTLAQLTRTETTLQATLDCTSGWYAHQDWTGMPLSALIHPGSDTQSLYVHSVTGYWVRFPVHDLDHLLLATRVAGAPLSADHGFPARLVAPNRRGYWWVKWVDRIEAQTTPSWWQPPFPLG